MRRLWLMLLTILIYIFIFYNKTESFSFEDGMLVIKNIDNKLIKKYKILTNLTIYEDELKHIFKNIRIARFYVPNNYYLIAKYNKKYVELPHGIHDIKYNEDGDIISQVEIKIRSLNNNVYVIDRIGNVIFRTNLSDRINWDYIYNDYGLNDYYVVYPWGRRLYSYHTHPNYRRSTRYPLRRYGNLRLKRK